MMTANHASFVLEYIVLASMPVAELDSIVYGNNLDLDLDAARIMQLRRTDHYCSSFQFIGPSVDI